MDKKIVSIFSKAGYILKKDFPKRYIASGYGDSYYVLWRDRDIRDGESFTVGGRDSKDLERLLKQAHHKKVLMIICDINNNGLFSHWVTRDDSNNAFSRHGLRSGYDGILANIINVPDSFKQTHLSF